MVVDGIDVYAGNGRVDWSQVPGVVGIVKATEGLYYIDRLCSPHMKQIVDSGKRMGTYHFIRAHQNWVDQANYFLGLQRYSGPIPPIYALDLEPFPGELWPLGPDETVAFTHAFLERVQIVAGVVPWLYTYPSFAASLEHVSAFWELARYPLWWADPSGNHPAPWPAALIQRGAVQVPGTTMPVDTNELGPAYYQTLLPKPDSGDPMITQSYNPHMQATVAIGVGGDQAAYFSVSKDLVTWTNWAKVGDGGTFTDFVKNV